jgi:galactokinase
MFNVISQTEQYHVIAPGRVNLLGEHVDYNGGPVLPAAIDLCVDIKAAPIEGQIQLHSVSFKQSVTFTLDSIQEKKDLHGNELPVWALYPAGVAWVLQNNGFEVRCLKADYSSALPIGAGLSSSAAVETGFAILWQEMAGWQLDRMQLAQLCRQAEVEYVQVNCGLMDQFACLCGVQGHGLYFDTQRMNWEAVPLPQNTALVIADSGIIRNLGNTAYNARRQTCQQALAELQLYVPGLKSLGELTPQLFDQTKDYLDEVQRKRVRHVVEECERVRRSVGLLKDGNVRDFGRLMVDSHVSLRDLYEVSNPELDGLVNIAMDLPGCWGARLTGAGFGGCTINLVDNEQVEPFISRLKGEYYHSFGRETAIYHCHAVSGAHLVMS